MQTSGIYINKGPLLSHPRRVFATSAIAALSSDDQKLFVEFGQGPLVPMSYSNIHHAFEDYAEMQPTAVAAIHSGQQITYAELNEQANQLAYLLASQGVKRGDNVALFVKRSIPMLVGILAILKLGAAYVPQDARITPENQLKHVMKMASTNVVLTLSDLVQLVPVNPDQIRIFLDQLPIVSATKAEIKALLEQRQLEANASDVCFVLFTSGTTGFPNGVEVTHHNLCNIIQTFPGNLAMGPGKKVSQILNIAFDMAAWEILGALSHGATLFIREKSIQEAAEQADVIIATPSILGTIDATKCKNVKTVAVAGEPCPIPLAESWSSLCTFYNSCGPTEVTIVNTMQVFEPGSSRISIGKPTPNNTVYILDENQKPCAIGDIGEMWAGGDCVSKGYVANEELTADRYRPDPFLGGDRRMFRTRDLGRWTKTGELEHFGRTDDQVKIRGFRVELDSVSNALEKASGCTQAVTLKLDSRNLVSFLRPKSVSTEAAKQLVGAALPYYCTPAVIIAMDEFPMTSRGKIDKRALTILAVAEQEKMQNNGALPSEVQL